MRVWLEAHGPYSLGGAREARTNRAYTHTRSCTIRLHVCTPRVHDGRDFVEPMIAVAVPAGALGSCQSGSELVDSPAVHV